MVSTLLWILVIGALFYFMMRKGGCCGRSHSGHSQHRGHSHGGSNTGTKDPVCGMEVEVTDAAMSRQHKGQTFYFCSSQCIEKFDKEPMTYMGPVQKQGGCC